MGARNTLYLKILLVLSIILEVQSRFIHFTPGYEYVYSFDGHSTVRDLGKFVVSARVRKYIYIYIYIVKNHKADVNSTGFIFQSLGV